MRPGGCSSQRGSLDVVLVWMAGDSRRRLTDNTDRHLPVAQPVTQHMDQTDLNLDILAEGSRSAQLTPHPMKSVSVNTGLRFLASGLN